MVSQQFSQAYGRYMDFNHPLVQQKILFYSYSSQLLYIARNPNVMQDDHIRVLLDNFIAQGYSLADIYNEGNQTFSSVLLAYTHNHTGIWFFIECLRYGISITSFHTKQFAHWFTDELIDYLIPKGLDHLSLIEGLMDYMHSNNNVVFKMKTNYSIGDILAKRNEYESCVSQCIFECINDHPYLNMDQAKYIARFV